jgi:glycosyltransferase involved in cell wall biosynthesis
MADFPMALPLTLLITCKDERSNIGPCIDSARQIADEVLVADSGSTDGTLEYVRARGDCRLIEREYVTAGDFKNWAIPKASNAWLLILDADERATPGLVAEIRELLARTPEHDGYLIRRANRLMGHPIKHTDWGRDKVLRLFRRDVCHYDGPSDHGSVHVRTGKIGLLKHPMDHFTIWTWEQYLKKFDRYTRIQAEQWRSAGKAPSFLRMALQPPLRFFRDFVLHLGFLEGTKGLQLAWMSAFYTFMKQARLWEERYGLKQEDVEAEAIAAAERRVRGAA